MGVLLAVIINTDAAVDHITSMCKKSLKYGITIRYDVTTTVSFILNLAQDMVLLKPSQQWQILT